MKERSEQQADLGTVARAAWMLGGAALVTAGLSRRSVPGALIAAGGAWLAYTGVTGRSPIMRRLGITMTREAYEKGVTVRRSMTMRRPAEEIYRRLRDFEAMPRILDRVESIEEQGDGGYRWRFREGPAVFDLEIDLVEDQPGRLISWLTRPQSRLRCDGTIRLLEAPGDRGTEVHVELRVTPPGGPMAMISAPMVRRLGRYQIGQSLHRIKQVLETGEITTSRMRPERELAPARETVVAPREMEVPR
jgi:uncharacterized membrane protein